MSTVTSGNERVSEQIQIQFEQEGLRPGSVFEYAPGNLTSSAVVGAKDPPPVTISCAHSGYSCWKVRY